MGTTPVDNNILHRTTLFSDQAVKGQVEAGGPAATSKPIDFTSPKTALNEAAAAENTVKKPGIFARLGQKLKKLGNKFKNTKIGTALTKAGTKIGGTAKKIGKTIAKPFKGIGNTLKGGFSKIGNLLKNLGTKLTKSKAGKKGLIAGAIGMILLGLGTLISKIAGKKDADEVDSENPEAETDPTVTPEETDPENPVAPGGETDPENPVQPGEDPDVVIVVPGEDGDKDTVVVVPGQDDENSEEARKAKNEYTVKRGDNVWNIAKRHLQEVNGRTPTNKEVLEETHRLMEVNGLKFEPDNYHVMIRPGDVIKYHKNPKFTKTIEVTLSPGKGRITIEADTQEELDKKVAEAQKESAKWENKDNDYKPAWKA